MVKSVRFQKAFLKQKENIGNTFIPSITFDADLNLLTINKFAIGSHVKFTPEIMRVFVAEKHSFSEGFWAKYHNGTFVVSPLQGAVLFNMVPHTRVSVVMEDVAHQHEMLAFSHRHPELTKSMTHSPIHDYISFNFAILTKASRFQTITIPTSL